MDESAARRRGWVRVRLGAWTSLSGSTQRIRSTGHWSAVLTALEGRNDSGVELLYFFDAHDALTGIVVNLACPVQCVQRRLFVSPDFRGEVKVLLRQR